MSWMENRRTTKIEDQAYCMLGLFNISLAPLYREGLKAFDRLQAKILQSTSDESIFAWDLKLRDSWRMLAQGPEQFVARADIRPVLKYRRKPNSITNQGLRFEFTRGAGVDEWTGADGRRALEVHLNCAASVPEYDRLCSMFLQEASCGHFIRRRPSTQSSVRPTGAQRVECASGPAEDVAPTSRQPVNDSEVIFIHMGMEHHYACRLSSADMTLGFGDAESVERKRERPRLLASDDR